MIVYKSRRFAVRRHKYGGSGIVSTIGSLPARYTTKAMLTDAAKKRKKVDINVEHSQELQLKKAFVDIGGIDINALIDGSGIALD